MGTTLVKNLVSTLFVNYFSEIFIRSKSTTFFQIRHMLPLYHVYVESSTDDFSWKQCEKTMTNEIIGTCRLYSRANHEFDDSLSNNDTTNQTDEDVILMKNKLLTMSNIETKQLFFVALPNTQEFATWDQFWDFANIDLNCVFGAVRIINPITKQVSICVQFKKPKFVQQCFHSCHGKRFFKTETLICHTLFALHVCFFFLLYILAQTFYFFVLYVLCFSLFC